MKNYRFVVGIDVSKKTLDVCLMPVQNDSNCFYVKLSNSLKGYQRLLSFVKLHKLNLGEGLFILEHTGMYSLILSLFLKEKGLNYSLIPGIVLKKSLGICRGKDDKKDAYAIARYGYLYREEIKLQPIKENALIKLQALFSQRRRMVTALKSLLVPINEMTEMGLADLSLQLENNQGKTIGALKENIKDIEKQILNVIENEPDYKNQYDLCTSVPGVGMQLGVYLIIVTHSFTRFQDSRKLATYAGVAPFPYRSGTSIRGRDKNNPLADKTLKSLIHMGALNAVRADKQLKSYYERKKAEGKNPMLVLNSVRNKLLARIMATVNRGTPYVQLAQHVA